jgi:two-component system nitrogen regulation sensor histidine kinase NtrY
LHGTLTVIVLGTSLILLLLIWSFRFIKELTRPIDQLLVATKKIEDGNRNLRIVVDSQDEFKLLADSFNSMLDALIKTSISEKYLNNILNNLYGALLVTDAEAKILSINSTTSKMLNYSKDELTGKTILSLFHKESFPPFAAKSGTTIGESGFRGDIRSHLMTIIPDTESMFTEDGSAVRDDATRPAALSPAYSCLGCHNDDPNDGIPDFTLEQVAAIANNMHASK